MEKAYNEEKDLEGTQEKTAHTEQLATEIFNSEKEYGYQETTSESSRVREISLRKKKGKHRSLHSRL